MQANNMLTVAQSQGDWLDKQLHNLSDQYDLIPYFGAPINSPKSYKTGEKYPSGTNSWHRASREQVGIRLNRLVLVDWDGYKPDTVSLEVLAEALGLTVEVLWTSLVQWDSDSKSLHFLFVMPEAVNLDEYKQANNGNWLKGVDIKTGNQLVYLKSHKGNYLDGFEPAVVPAPALAALKIEGTASTHINTNHTLDAEAVRIINKCDPDAGYDDWMTVITGTVDQYGHGEEVINTLDNWSSKGAKYSGRAEIESKVRSITRGGGKTWGSVKHMAGETRAQVIPISAAEAFKGYQLPPDSPSLKCDSPNVVEQGSIPSVMGLNEMLSKCVWVSNGQRVAYITDTNTAVVPWVAFTADTAPSKTQLAGTVRKELNANLWKCSAERRTVDTITFQAGADVICKDPDGLNAVNTWRPILRTESHADITLFHEHLAYLFTEYADRERFLDWLAHIEQKPGELPHYGFLHVADNTGTGRNCLASLLKRIWQRYTLPNADLEKMLDSQFNSALADTVLAVVDEIQAGDGNNYKHKNVLKSMVNCEYRDINTKNQAVYRVHNACRWLVFSNHINALPIDDQDRRWHVVHTTAAPRDASYYVQLHRAFSNPEFVQSVAWFLKTRDISLFNPGARPEMNTAKQKVIRAGKSDVQIQAEHLVKEWPSDIISNTEAAKFMSDNQSFTITPHMRRCLTDLGAVCGAKRTQDKKMIILRNVDRWINETGATCAAEMHKGTFVDTTPPSRRLSYQ